MRGKTKRHKRQRVGPEFFKTMRVGDFVYNRETGERWDITKINERETGNVDLRLAPEHAPILASWDDGKKEWGFGLPVPPPASPHTETPKG